jgi:SAM-dependent methyltransferase
MPAGLTVGVMMTAKNCFPDPEDQSYEQRGHLEQVPGNVSYLSSVAAEPVSLSSIGFRWYPASQHLAIENFQPPQYYEDYLMTASYSDRMQALQAGQMERMMSLHAESGQAPASLIEVGCGDGSFLKHATRHLARVVGVEPSQRFADEALQNGFEVIVGFVGADATLTDERFDSFASRQVFEHLPDPLDVLTGVRRMLNPGAIGLIEVPNGYRALRLKRFFEFFPDHVNYYSVNSLVALASAAGLNVISCEESFGGDYLELWLRNEPDIAARAQEIAAHREQVVSALTEKVKAVAASGQSNMIWGCGAKTLSVLSAASPEVFQHIAGIIDSDPHKHGRFVPNSSIEIMSPPQAAALKPDVVFVLALSYREEIAESARQTLPSCRRIYSLDDHGAVIEL